MSSGPSSGQHHDHGRGAALLSAGARHRRRLVLALGLIAAFFVVEAIAGVLTNSLALLSDAGHMFTDVLALGMALAAITLAARHQRRGEAAGPGRFVSRHTFGLYRLEILAALANAVLLAGVAIYVLVEAARRLGGDADVDTTPMIVVASLGLAVNVVAFALLRKGARESLNLEGAYLEVLADTLGSIAAIGAGAVVAATGWVWVDAAAGAGIGLWILPRAWRLGARAVRILNQSAPPTIDLATLESELAGVPEVVDVHDLHVWTLTSGMEAMSAHLVVCDGADHHSVLDEARALAQQTYDIDHSTFQIEPAAHQGCDAVTW